MKKSSVIHPHRCLNFQFLNLLHISKGDYIERVHYPCYIFHVLLIDRNTETACRLSSDTCHCL